MGTRDKGQRPIGNTQHTMDNGQPTWNKEEQWNIKEHLQNIFKMKSTMEH